MVAPSSTTSTNSPGEAREVRGAARRLEPPHPPSARILRLASYIGLVEADYLNDELARTILATVNGPELGGLDAEERAVLEKPARQMASALCLWLITRPEIPIADIIAAVPRLRSLSPTGAWPECEQASAEVLDRYRAAKQAFRFAPDAEQRGEVWSIAAKRAVLGKLVVDGLTRGEGAALDDLLGDVALIGSFFPFTFNAGELTGRMEQGGWYDQLSRSDLDLIARRLVGSAPLLSDTALQHILLLLNFRASSPFSHNARVYESIIAPLARRFFALGLLEQAYTLVHWSLNFHAYRLPDEAAFGQWVESFAAASAAAGRRLKLPMERSGSAAHRRTRLAFVTRGGSVSTAAADHILRILDHLRRDQGERFDARLYVFDRFDPDMEEACARRDIDVRFVVDDGIGADRIMDKLVRLQQILVDDGADVAVWTHAYDLVFFAFGLRLAPLQILFSQYLHPQPDGVDVDAYMTWGSPVLVQQTFCGRPWRVVPSALRFDRSRVDDAEVCRLRSSYARSGTIIVGTLARTEKVGQRDYLGAVVALLRRHRNLVFLWTGLAEQAEITGAFREAGVLDQTRFVGWVNTSVFVRLLDVLLDTFPLSNGLTALEAMSRGTPVLSLDTPLSFAGRDITPAFDAVAPPASRRGALASEIRKLFDDGAQDAVFAACSPEDYVDKASRLVSDAALRSRCGATWRRVYELIYEDEFLMGETFVEQLVDIIGERVPARLRGEEPRAHEQSHER